MNSNTATYSGFEFEIDGFPALAVINQNFIDKTIQINYPFSIFIEIVPDTFNKFGHPEGAEQDYLIEVEKKMIDYLEEQTITVHVGNTTTYHKREIIFYTKESEKVQGFLNYFLSTIERENNFEIESDAEWKNVSAFYALI